MSQDAKASVAPQDLLQDLLSRARRAGASSADAMLVDGTSLSVTWANGRLESIERSEGGDLDLRVFVGHRQAVVSVKDRSPASLDAIAQRAVDMARTAPEDPHCGLADPADLGMGCAALAQADDAAPDAATLIDLARAAEDAALSVPGVSRSEAAGASAGGSHVYFAATNGFVHDRARTHYAISMTAVAGQGTDMVQDHDYAARVYFADLPSAATIGRKAGERAARSLAPRRMPTCKGPVVFEPRVAADLLAHFLDAISGFSIARGTSFLKDSLGTSVFAKGVQVIEDPHKARGPRSRVCDAEGLPTRARALIEDGVLTTWLLDSRSARQLGLKSTGHASRGPGGVPSPAPSNVCFAKGTVSPDMLMRDIQNGFYVTELMGMGVNEITGDFSEAARGFWIENGTIAHPVCEMTIAGNLKDMFKSLSLADDLEGVRGIDSPTVRVDSMTIAGL